MVVKRTNPTDNVTTLETYALFNEASFRCCSLEIIEAPPPKNNCVSHLFVQIFYSGEHWIPQLDLL